MENQQIYSLFARILPPLLGLGLIELYVERDVNIVTVAIALVALGVVMIIGAALADLLEAGRREGVKRRRRRSRG